MTVSSALSFIPVGEHAAIAARNSTYDATSDLQDWLDFCKTNKVKGFLDAGRYRITGPLFLTIDQIETCHIEGEGGGTAQQHTKSEIEATQLDTPALCIQNGRSVCISNIGITGANVAPDSVGAPSVTQCDYITAGIRTTRYSPHCAICIDPAVGNVPPDGGYSGMTYQGFTGGTASVIIDNVSIRNFAVGIMFSPDGESTQGDNMRIHNCIIHYCDILVSVGQTQNNSITITESDLGHCRFCCLGDEHGTQKGVGVSISNTQIIRSYGIFRFGSDLKAMSISNVYAENVCTIGSWGSGFASTRLPLCLTSCDFNFATTSEGRDAPILLVTNGPTKIIGCNFGDREETIKVMNFVGGAKRTFDSCTFLGDWQVGEALVSQGRAMEPSQFFNCELLGDTQQPFLLDFKSSEHNVLSIRNITNIVITADQISFDTTDAGKRASLGSIIFWTILPQLNIANSYDIPALVIVDVNGNTITCDMLFDSSVYDNTNESSYIILEPYINVGIAKEVH